MHLIPLHRSSSNASPDCKLLEICDLQLLLECPLDLSPLSLFLPTEEAEPQNAARKKPKIDAPNEPLLGPPFKRIDDEVVIDAEPWYQSADLDGLDVALIDAVVISTPESMLALPFLTRNPDFTAKVFATFVTATIGKLLMQELVSSHRDFVKFFGQAASTVTPQFTQVELTAALPQVLKDRLLGEQNSAISNWHKLYSAEDVFDCMKKVQCLRYGEEASIKGCLVVTPYSSGQSLGASNWMIKGPCSSLTYVSCPDGEVNTATCASQDLRSLGDGQVLLVSGSKSSAAPQKHDTAQARKRLATRPWISARVEFVTSQNPKPVLANSVSDEKLDLSQNRSPALQIAKAAAESLSRGGCVLIPVSVSDRVLELIEVISEELSHAKVSGKVFYVSPSAQEFLAFTNTVPEWTSPSRQAKFYNAEPLFGHVELLKEGKLSQFSNLSPEIIESGPCVVLASHGSLRMGPSVHLLNIWKQRSSYLLMLVEPDVDVEKTLLPFRPISMEVKHLPLTFGTRSPEALSSLIECLQPKLTVVPDYLKAMLKTSPAASALSYTHRLPLKLPDLAEAVDMELSGELASRIKPKPTRAGNAAALARLSAEMHFHDGDFHLEMPKVSRMIQAAQRFCGRPDMDALLRALREKGLGDIQQSYLDEDDGSKTPVISVTFQSSASIELKGKETIIKTSDPVLRRLITDAVISCLQII